MLRMSSALPLALAATLGAACTDDDPKVTPPTWQTLVGASWSLDPGEERTSQLSVSSVAEDVAITAIRPIAPRGTHHTLLVQGDAGLQSTNIIYASGVGTSELQFPPGVAMRLDAGTLLGLQLHIYNNSDEVLTGESGIEIQTIDRALVEHEVDLFLPGPKDLALPPGATTVSGTCTVTSAQTVFALFPHMHQYGRHLKTTLTIGGVPQVLHDAAYSFDHQAIETFTPIQLNPGDTITTECGFDNTSSATVTYGESSDTEMCYSILFRYPDDGVEFCED